MKNTIFIILVICFSVVLHARKPKLAVMSVDDRSEKLSEKVKSGVTTLLRMYLSSSGQFIVIDEGRQQKALSDIIQEKKKESYKKCYNEQCQIPLGQALSADTILRSTVTELGGMFSLGVELIDLAKEATTKAANVEFDGTEAGIRSAVKKVVNELTGKTVEEAKLLAAQQKQAEIDKKIAEKKEKKRLQKEKKKALDLKLKQEQQIKLAEQKREDQKVLAFKKKYRAAGSKRRGLAWTSFLSGFAFVGTGIGMFALSSNYEGDQDGAYVLYLASQTEDDAVKYRNETEDYQRKKNVSKVLGGIFVGVGAALTTTGIILWSVKSSAEKKVKKNYSLTFRVDPFSRMATLSLRY